MRFAIVESGGKQYRATEGRTIEVDRLPVDAGNQFDFERVLLMADGDDILVGTPTIGDILVKVTVVDHVKGPKIDRFKYRPKKRIRVRGGHRQQYTRLLIDFIGRPDEEEKRKSAKAEAARVVVEETPEVEEAPKAKASTKKSSAKPAAAKSTSKKTDTKKK
jgi:large subunit ribosomal protein L21